MSIIRLGRIAMGKIVEESFGDFDWEDFGDEGFGDFSAEPPKDDRHPGTKIAGAFLEGVKENLLNPSTQARFVRDVLPEGYKVGLDAVDGVVSGAKDILDEAKKAAKPIIKDIKKGTRLFLPKVEAVLPEGIINRLKELSADDERKPSRVLSKDEVEANATNVELGVIFNAHMEAQKRREEESKAEQQLKDIAFMKQGDNNLLIQYQLNQNLKRLVEYNDQVTAQYQRKSLELQFKHYFVSRRLLDTMEKHLGITEVAFQNITKNTGLPDIIKYQNHEKMIDQLKTQIFGKVSEPLSQWYRGVGSRIVKKAKGEIKTFFSDVGGHINDAVMGAEQIQTDIGEQLETVRDLGGDSAVDDLRMQLAGGGLGNMASDYVLKKFIDPIKAKLANNEILGVNELKLLRKFARMPMQARDFANSSSDGFGFGDRVMDWAKQAAGRNKPEVMVQKSGVDELEQEAFITNKTIRTWEEVIPGWLSKIHKEMKAWSTGDPNTEQEYFNFETSSFESASKVKADIREQMVGKKKKSELNYYADRLMKYIDPTGTALSAEAVTALRKYIIKLAWDGGKDFDVALLANEYKFPPTIPSAVKPEIIKHIRDRFKFDDSVEMDEDNNFVKDPFKEDIENQKALLGLSTSYGSLVNNIPDAMKEALKAAKLNRIGLMQEQGFVDLGSDGTTYNLNREKILEMLLEQEPPAPPAGAPGLWRGGLFDGGGAAIHRNTGDLVDAPGSGANDTANAMLANREFVVNARSTGLPGVLPLLRYINSMGNQSNGVNQSIAAEDGISADSKVENAIHRFHDDYKTNSDKAISLMEAMLTKLEDVGKFSLTVPDFSKLDMSGFGKQISESLTASLDGAKVRAQGMRDKYQDDLTLLQDRMENTAEWTKDRAKKLKGLAIDGLGVSEELKKKLAEMEIESLFSKGIPDIKELKNKLKNTLSEEDLKVVLAEYKKYHKRMEELRKQGLSSGERAASSAAKTVTDAMGAIPKLLKGLREGGKRRTDYALDKLGLAFDWGTGKLGEGKQKFKDMVSDVWVSGETKPRLLSTAMRAGAYVDSNTGKVIEKFSDITGEVKDKMGNVVLSFADYEKGLFNPNGKSIFEWMTKKAKQAKDLAFSPIAAIKSKGTAIFNKIVEIVDGPEDVYVVGEMDKPRLYAVMMELGKYRVKDTGVIVKRVSDIKGVIEEVDGDNIKVVLTLEDIKKGLVNSKGEKFKTLSGIAANLAKMAIAKGLEAGKKVLDVAKKGFGYLTDLLKSGGKRLGKFTGSMSDLININMFASTKDVVNRLDTIIKMLESKGFKKGEVDEGSSEPKPEGAEGSPEENTSDDQGVEEVMPKGKWSKFKDSVKEKADKLKSKFKRKTSGDADGDGDRDNSAADRAQNRERDRAANEERSKWQRLTDALKQKGGQAKDGASSMLSSLLTKLTPMLAGAATLITTVATSAGKVLGLLGKVGMFLGKGAIGAVKLAGRAVLGTGKLLLRAAPTIGRVALGVARVGLGVITGPVGLALTAAYIGYKLYEHYTRENAPLTRFRMAQYGYKHDDKENVAKIITLEQECLKIVKVNPGKLATLGAGKTISELSGIFGVNVDKQEDLEKWIAWFQHRFKPIFLASVTELFTFTGKTTLGDIDKLLLTKQKREFIRKLHSLKIENNPYKVLASPFAGEENVQLSQEDINDAFDTAMKYIDDNAEKNDRNVANTGSKAPAAKEEKGWWDVGKEKVAALGAGIAALASKAANKVAGGARAAYDGAVNSGSSVIGKTVALGGAIASAGSSLYQRAVDAASGAMEATANVFKVNKAPMTGTKKENFKRVMEAAQAAGDPHPEIVAAQWAVESGWGKSQSGKYNFFGIKASPNEPHTLRQTREVVNGKDVFIKARFKDYNSLEDGIRGRVAFLQKNPRYEKAGYSKARTPYEAASTLQRAGYATDPNYANILGKILAGVGIDPLKPKKDSAVADVPSYGPALNTPLAVKKESIAANGKIDQDKPFMLQPISKSGGSTTNISSSLQVQQKTDIDPDLVELGKRSYRAGEGVDMKMDPSFANKVYGLFGEYFKKTKKVVVVNSCFRDPKKQLKLYNAYISRSKRPPLVAKPGKSKHQYGLAIDISSEQANEMDKLGLLRKYGISRPLLRHPRYSEPWHLENDSSSPTTAEESDTVNYIDPLTSPLGTDVRETNAISIPLKPQPAVMESSKPAPATTSSAIIPASSTPATTDDSSFMMQGVKPSANKTTAAIETKRESESKAATESMSGLSAIAKEQLKQTMRSADTLDNIYSVLQRMERRPSSNQPQVTQQPVLPNKPAKEAPIDLSRTF